MNVVDKPRSLYVLQSDKDLDVLRLTDFVKKSTSHRTIGLAF